MRPFIRAALVAATLLIPLAVSAQFSIGGNINISFGNGCGSTVCAVAQNILVIINNILVPILFAIAFIVFLYGIAKAYIFSAGEPEEVAKGHKLLLWGIIAFVIMVSLWGLVNVVANTFGLAGAYAPPTPSSISPYGSMVQPGGGVIVQPGGTQQPPSGNNLDPYTQCLQTCGATDNICRNNCLTDNGFQP